MTKTTKKSAVKAKPKTASGTSAKRVKRTTATKRKTTTAAKRATQKATQSAKTQTQAATKTAQFAADDIMQMSTDVVRNFFGNAMPEMPAAGENVFAMTREGSEQLAKSADQATKSLNDAFEMSRENVEAAVNCGNIAANASKSLGAEMVNYANKTFAENVELSKDMFNCRTLNDVFEMQNRVMKTNLDNFFSESLKMSQLMFQCASEVAEPINQRISETTERLTKNMAA